MEFSISNKKGILNITKTRRNVHNGACLTFNKTYEMKNLFTNVKIWDYIEKRFHRRNWHR